MVFWERSMRMRLFSRYCFLLLLLLVISPFFPPTQSTVYPTANASTSWTNNGAEILLCRGSFGCGFFCNDACDASLFAIFIFGDSEYGFPFGTPQVVWSANRNHPVKENATLHFSKDGNLILQDHDGTPVWSTNAEGRSVTRMSLTMMGNLVLLDERDAPICDSFNYPTDSWIPGQTLRKGQRLTADVSPTNWTESQLYLTTVPGGLAAYADFDPPQFYYSNY